MTEPTSWILDVRRRLAAGPAREPLVADSARRALAVPLFVDAGGLWVLLREGEDGAAEMAAGPVAGDQESWEAAVEAAGAAGLPSEALLQLGELEPLERPEGGLDVPCVGALPTAAGLAAADRSGWFKLPLVALSAPTLVEEVEVEHGGVKRRMHALHVGGRRLWGAAVFVIEDLLERLRE